MSQLYGTVTNEDSKTSTRTARRIITAAAQSYEGSVAVTIRYQDGIPVVDIAAGPGSDSDPSRVLLTCPLSYLVNGIPEKHWAVSSLSVDFVPSGKEC